MSDMTDREIKLTSDVALLRAAMDGLMAWHLTDDCYVRIGFVKGGAERAYSGALEAMVFTK